MAALDFRRLPVQADDGFPQAFRLRLGAAGYLVALYVNLVDDPPLGLGEPPPQEVLDLPQPGAFMVATVTREGPAGGRVLLRRKLVTGHVYHAAELALIFTELRVDRRNLNGVGAFGSRVEGGVALRWAL